MFLVRYTYRNDNTVSNNSSFMIVHQYHINDMFVELHETLNGHKASIDSDLFRKMIKQLSIEESVELFNSINKYQICDIYKNLEEVFISAKEETV